MNKIIALADKRKSTAKIQDIISGHNLGDCERVNKIHNSNAPTQSPKENAGRFLAAMRAIEENAYGWIQKIQQMMHDEKNLDEINQELLEKIGYTVSQDVKIQLPLFINQALRELPVIVLKKYELACQKQDGDRFVRQFLGAGEVCIQGMYEKVVSYEPLSFTEIEPIPDDCKTDNELKMGFLRSQRDVKCIEAFRRWYAGPEHENYSDGEIMQSPEFKKSPYAETTVGYRRGLVQLFRESQYEISDDEIRRYMKTSFNLEEDKLQLVMGLGVERVKESMLGRELGVRIEALTRGKDTASRDMAGMERTFDKFQSGTPFPVVGIGQGYPVNTYIRRFMSAGLLFEYYAESLFLASKADFGSDGIMEIQTHTAYLACTSPAEKAKYIESALNLRPNSLITEYAEWKDKMQELSDKVYWPDEYKSSKYSLKVLDMAPAEIVALTDVQLDSLIQKYNRENDYQVRNALRKLKKLTKEERVVYLGKAEAPIAPPKSQAPSSKEVIPAVHNEILVRGTAKKILGVYVDLSLPGTYNQAKELQRIVQEINGGERLPIILYSSTETKVEEITLEGLDAIEIFLEQLKLTPENLDGQLSRLLKENQSFVPIKDMIYTAAINFLMKYYLSNLELEKLSRLLESQNFSENESIQCEFVGVFEGLLRLKGIVDLFAVKDNLNWLLPYLFIIFDKSTQRAKVPALQIIATIATNQEAKEILSQNDGLIAKLIQLLNTGTDKAKEYAAYAIATISVNQAAIEIFSQNNDLIAALIELLNTGTDKAKDYALHAIATISANQAAQEKFSENDGLIARLIQLFNTGTEYEKESALYAIANITVNKAAKEIFSQNDELIATLIQLINTGTDKAKESALHAIANIAVNQAAKEKFIKNNGLITGLLIQLLNTGTEKSKEYAACAIANISTNQAAQKIFSKNDVLIAALIQLINTGKEKEKEYATRAIANISANKAAKEIFSQNNDLIAALIQLINTCKEKGKEFAARAISNISKNKAAQKKFSKNDVLIAALIQLINTGTEKAKELAAHAMATIATDEAAKKKFSKNDVLIAALIRLINTGTETAKENANWLIINMNKTLWSPELFDKLDVGTVLQMLKFEIPNQYQRVWTIFHEAAGWTNLHDAAKKGELNIFYVLLAPKFINKLTRESIKECLTKRTASDCFSQGYSCLDYIRDPGLKRELENEFLS